MKKKPKPRNQWPSEHGPRGHRHDDTDPREKRRDYKRQLREKLKRGDFSD